MSSTNSAEIRQKNLSVIKQMQEFAKAEAEARAAGDTALADEKSAAFTKAEAEQRALEKQLRATIALEETERQQAGEYIEDLDKRGQKVGQSRESEIREAVRAFFAKGHFGLTHEQRAILAVPDAETRAQSTTNTAGGYTIPEAFMNVLERAMKDYSGIMQAARIITTDTGAPMPWATLDGTARKAAIVAENAQSTPVDFTFGVKTLNAYMYRDMAAASLEIIQDSAFDIPAFLSDSFAESFGRGLNTDFTLGDDNNKPNGVVTASALGTTAASATAFTRSELVDHMHKVDPGYRKSPKCGWMFNDQILAAIKKLALGSNDATPLWQPSMRDGAPDRIEGFPYWINQDMSSTMTTGQRIILFGDFNKYIIRQVRGLFIRRLEERFIDFGQIGFIGFARYDGELISSAAIKHLKLA